MTLSSAQEIHPTGKPSALNKQQQQRAARTSRTSVRSSDSPSEEHRTQVCRVFFFFSSSCFVKRHSDLFFLFYNSVGPLNHLELLCHEPSSIFLIHQWGPPMIFFFHMMTGFFSSISGADRFSFPFFFLLWIHHQWDPLCITARWRDWFRLFFFFFFFRIVFLYGCHLLEWFDSSVGPT